MYRNMVFQSWTTFSPETEQARLDEKAEGATEQADIHCAYATKTQNTVA